jgi:hypothetical protein
MNELTLSDVHLDDRYLWKTLPSMKTEGMDYPLLCWIMDAEHWDRFCFHTPDYMLDRLPPPNLVGDTILLIKGGNNRYQAARDLGYLSIDCMLFDDQLDSIKWTRYLLQCDPLRNPDLPYLGLVDYK